MNADSGFAALMPSREEIDALIPRRKRRRRRRRRSVHMSWFVVKMSTDITTSLSSLVRITKAAARSARKKSGFTTPDPAMLAKAHEAIDKGLADMAAYTVDVFEDEKRTYWQGKGDPLEGLSEWTDFRNFAMKWRHRADAEKFAFELVQRFPPYLHKIKVERLRWSYNQKLNERTVTAT